MTLEEYTKLSTLFELTQKVNIPVFVKIKKDINKTIKRFSSNDVMNKSAGDSKPYRLYSIGSVTSFSCKIEMGGPVYIFDAGDIDVEINEEKSIEEHEKVLLEYDLNSAEKIFS